MNKKYVAFIVLCLILGSYFFILNDKQPVFIKYKFNTNEINKYYLVFTQQICQNTICETFILKANLYTQVKEINKSDIWLIVKLKDIEITNNNSILIKKIQQIYQNPFLLLISKNGIIKKFIFKGDEQNYGGLKQMFYYMDIPILNKNKYKLMQKDTLGEYEAEYKIKTNNIKKKILHYNKLFKPDLIDRIKITKSSFNIIIKDTHNWIDNLEGETTSELFYNNQLLSLSKNKFLLKFIQIENNDIFKKEKEKSIKVIKKEFKSIKLNIYKDILIEQYKEEFKTVDIKTVVDSLDNSLLSYSKLKDYLNIYPEKIIYIVDIFDNLNDKKQSRILGYLGLISNNSEIQSGLIDIYQNNSTSKINKIRDIISLGFTTKPTNETINFLLQELYNDNKDISNTIILAIGKISKYDSSLEETIIEYYRNGTYSQKQLAIKAMKNSNSKYFKNFLTK